MVKEHIKGEVGTIEMPMPYAGGFSQFLTTDPRTVKHILKDKFDNCKPRRPWVPDDQTACFLFLIFPDVQLAPGPPQGSACGGSNGSSTRNGSLVWKWLVISLNRQQNRRNRGGVRGSDGFGSIKHLPPRAAFPKATNLGLPLSFSPTFCRAVPRSPSLSLALPRSPPLSLALPPLALAGSKLGPADGPLGRNVWDFLGGGIFNLRHGLVSGPEHAKWFHQRKVCSSFSFSFFFFFFFFLFIRSSVCP